MTLTETCADGATVELLAVTVSAVLVEEAPTVIMVVVKSSLESVIPMVTCMGLVTAGAVYT